MERLSQPRVQLVATRRLAGGELPFQEVHQETRWPYLQDRRTQSCELKLPTHVLSSGPAHDAAPLLVASSVAISLHCPSGSCASWLEAAARTQCVSCAAWKKTKWWTRSWQRGACAPPGILLNSGRLMWFGASRLPMALLI